ncbi:autoinducer kinase [Salmonella sp. NCTC 11881]|nr:autoinducer kinase [Salmonella sp. NCTC 11881]
MAGLRSDILSPVKETGTLLGHISQKAAEQCDLQAGTPVIVGGGDVQLGCLGLGVVRPAQNGRAGRNLPGNRSSIFPRRSPTQT